MHVVLAAAHILIKALGPSRGIVHVFRICWLVLVVDGRARHWVFLVLGRLTGLVSALVRVYLTTRWATEVLVWGVRRVEHLWCRMRHILLDVVSALDVYLLLCFQNVLQTVLLFYLFLVWCVSMNWCVVWANRGLVLLGYAVARGLLLDRVRNVTPVLSLTWNVAWVACFYGTVSSIWNRRNILLGRVFVVKILRIRPLLLFSRDLTRWWIVLLSFSVYLFLLLFS